MTIKMMTSSSIIQIYHRFMDKLCETSRSSTFIENSGVISATVNGVLYGLKPAIREPDMINSGCSNSVSALRVSKLVPAVVVLNSELSTRS